MRGASILYREACRLFLLVTLFSFQLPFGASYFDVGTGSPPQVDMGSGMA